MNKKTTLKAIFAQKLFHLPLKMDGLQLKYPVHCKENFSDKLYCDSSYEVEF
jgi:hypothetical protein